MRPPAEKGVGGGGGEKDLKKKKNKKNHKTYLGTLQLKKCRGRYLQREALGRVKRG